MPTIERIYPKDLDPHSRDDQNTLRIHLQRQELAAGNLSGQHILDMACGCGYGTALLAERPLQRQITGVDIDPAAIAYDRQHYRLPNLRYVCADAERFAAAQPFDSIVSLETIEHLPSAQRLIDNYARLLATGGRVIASVPTTPPLDGNPHRLHDFSRRSFFALFRRNGLRPRAHVEQVQ